MQRSCPEVLCDTGNKMDTISSNLGKISKYLYSVNTISNMLVTTTTWDGQSGWLSQGALSPLNH